MGKCRDCKWWHRWAQDYPRGTCEVITAPVSNATRAWVEAPARVSRLEAELQTRPDFGCVQFELAREVNPAELYDERYEELLKATG